MKPTHDINRIMERTDLYNVEVASRLDPNRRSKMGQFFTPSTVSGLMTSMFNPAVGEIRLLDAGAGTGALTAAFVQHACSQTVPPTRITATAYEVEPALLEYLAQSLKACAALCQQAGVRFDQNIQERDFIAAGVEMLNSPGPLFAPTQSTFNRAILNPPYKKIRSTSEHRHLLSSIGIETSNLYSGFLAIAIRLLEPGGELVAITPRSFCNGPYFRPFRELLLDEVALQRIHVFESRNKAFGKDDVLQENIIFHAIKGAEPGSVVISANEGPDDPVLSYREVQYHQVVSPQDPQRFIHVAANDADQLVVDRIHVLTRTLEDLDIEVSTGRVVDFRAREHLQQNPASGSVPLIYPTHFDEGFVRWPKPDSKKPNAIAQTEDTESLLLPAGNYVLVKRFSAKEEPRRVTAALYLEEQTEAQLVGFENHLNVYHRHNQGLPPLFAQGLAVYLNSTLVDQYFRQFSGHTQVNATDLRTLNYPSAETLERLGGRVGTTLPSQTDIDQLLEEELNTMAEIDSQDPALIEQKIQEAVEILRLLGMPRGQLNDRTGLTLLALLGLRPETPWSEASAPLMGITPIMEFIAEYYGRNYAPNTRETIRRQSMHQMVSAGFAVENPDKPNRATNSPHFCYQVAEELLALLVAFGTAEWEERSETFLAQQVETLRDKYAMLRNMEVVPITLPDGSEIQLSPGKHSELMRAIVEEFGPRFIPGGELLYLGDTAGKWKHFEERRIEDLGTTVDAHGKMPDVIIYDPERHWLVLIEAVTSHGPVDSKRREELATLFANADPGLVYVTAFLTRSDMARYVSEISWATEVWVLEAKTHLIHFNGVRFLGPYET